MTEPNSPEKIVKYVAYYRVSTDRQGTSGLGLDAQREAVRRFLGGRGQLLNEFTESGRRHANRFLYRGGVGVRPYFLVLSLLLVYP